MGCREETSRSHGNGTILIMTSQAKYENMDNKVAHAPDVDPSLRQPREWEKGCCDPSHWFSGGCCVYTFCPLFSLFCCLPHSMAAVARKINWRGFAKTNQGAYATNKWRWNCFNATSLAFLVVILILNATVLRSIVFNNASEVRRYNYEYQECLKLGPNFADECIVNIDPITVTSVLPLIIILVPFALAITIMEYLLAIYVVMLRYNMRNKLNIKTMQLCEKFGAVGGMFEDLLCLSCCLPCTLSQMQDQVNVDVAYCCSGEDPGHSDSNLIV